MTVTSLIPSPAMASQGIHNAGWHSLHAPPSVTRQWTHLAAPARSQLPSAQTILAVTARPGQESADLGALLYAFRRAGGTLTLLTLTRGEGSVLNSTRERLETVRLWELQVAAGLLGISSVAMADFPDGRLGCAPAAALTERVARAIRTQEPDLLLVVDPAAGNQDEVAVASAAASAGCQAGVPGVARTLPGALGSWKIDLAAEAGPARAAQRSAAAAHASQSGALVQVLTRLDRLDGREHLRWLTPDDEMLRLPRP